MDIKNSASPEDGQGVGISSVVATLIAKGLIAGEGFDLNLYRPEPVLDDEDHWKVEFKLKERYLRFNIRCPMVFVNKRTGEIGQVSYQNCDGGMPMEHATKATPSSLPQGSIGIYLGDEKQFLFEIFPWEWEALFWDELRATDPRFSPDWQKRFADSIPDFPLLSRIRGEYGSAVTFETVEIDELRSESARVAKSAKNPVALDVAKRVLTACELVRERNSSIHFRGY